MSTLGVDFIEQIREFLGGEEGRVFAQRARQYGLAEDGPELLPMIVLARAAERSEAAAQVATEALSAFRSEAGGMRDTMGRLKTELVGSVGGEIEDRIVQSIDDVQREVAGMCRALAHSELSAASTVRTRAIAEEVAELRRAAAEGPNAGASGAPAQGTVGSGDGFALTMRELAYFVAAAGGVGAIVAAGVFELMLRAGFFR